MEHFLLSFYIVFPLFFYILLGFCIQKLKLMDADSFNKLNKTIFQIFIPLMLFVSVYQADFSAALNPKLFFYACSLIVLVCLLSCIILPRFFPNRKDAPVMIQGIYRSNYVLFGLTLAGNLYPNSDIGIVSSLAAIAVPIFNVLSVIVFEVFRGQKVNVSRLLKGIITNPLIIAGILGILCSLLQFKFPAFLEKSLADAASLASPVALICLGGMLSFSSMKNHRKELIVVIMGRLIVLPAAALVIFTLLGYRNIELTAILALFASPTAVASNPMAQAMGGNSKLAGEIVATTSVFSILTIFLFVWFLKFNGLVD